MKITVEFDSLEEFQKHITFGNEIKITDEGIFVRPSHVPPGQSMEERTNVVMTPDIKADEIATGTEKPAEKAQEEPAEEKTEDSAPFEEKPKIDESYRLEVRKKLAALNKLQTGNPAKALIMETGYKRLTDVPLDLLPRLMEKAEEAMNNV